MYKIIVTFVRTWQSSCPLISFPVMRIASTKNVFLTVNNYIIFNGLMIKISLSSNQNIMQLFVI